MPTLYQTPGVYINELTGPGVIQLTITHNYSRSLLPARKPAASKVRS